MKTYLINDKESGQTLEKYVRKVLSEAPLSFIYKLFRKKDIKVNGHWEKEKYIVKENDEMSIYVTDQQLEDFHKRLDYQPNDSIKDWIIYEDKNILLINKPRNVLVQKDDHSHEKALDQLVVEYLMFKGEYDPLNDHGFKPGPAHRIDRNTSGIVMFGKNHQTLTYLFELLKEHEKIGKHYITLVCGDIDKDGEIDAPLRKNFDLKKVVVASTKDGGKTAKTIYHVLKRFGEYTLLDVTLVTGRTHQIRAHMSYIRHHVVGDTKYGDFKVNNYFKKTFGFTDQFLHASELHFGHLNKPLDYLSSQSFKAPLGEEYQTIIEALEKGEQAL